MTAHRLGQAACLVSMIALSAAGSAMAQSVDDDVRAAYAAWDEAFNAGDGAALASMYTDDALFLPVTHEVITGPEGVQEFFAPVLEMGVSGHKLELIEVREQGDAVVAAATWSANGKDDAGADQPWGGVATHVFERQEDGSLKLALHTFN